MADAISNLYAHRQRSALALLGVVIGTASVVAMLTIGHMAENESLRLFSHMGVNKLVAQTNGGTLGGTGLSEGAITSLPRRLPAILQAAPVLVGQAQLYVGDQSGSVGVVGTTPALQALAGLQMARGRFLQFVDGDGQVAVVGAGAAAKLSAPGDPLGVGSRVRLDHYLFTVIGVLEPEQATAFDPADFNDAIIIPLSAAPRALGPTPLSAALARIAPTADAVAASAALQADLQRASPRVQLEVRSARQLIQALKAQKAVHTRLLAAIGGISLLVGGIGVMNVMLMSVMERRREIGLRAAIGASPSDIQLMFLVEAGALALLGGVVGDLLGLGAALIAAKTSGWAFSPALYPLPLGAGVAALVGIAFGLYPAIKASRLDPIEALRAE